MGVFQLLMYAAVSVAATAAIVVGVLWFAMIAGKGSID